MTKNDESRRIDEKDILFTIKHVETRYYFQLLNNRLNWIFIL